MGVCRKFYALVFCAISLSFSVCAAVPAIPSNCFSSKHFCSESSVIRERGKKVIKVIIAAKFVKSKYTNPSELVDLYFDFAKWPDYAAGSSNLNMDFSEVLFVRDSNGVEKKRHHVSYTAKAPWPIRNMKVHDLVEYDSATVVDGALIFAKFESVANFQDREGIKLNWGEVYVLEQGKHYVVLFINKVIPSISILPSVAAPYIERPMLDIFKGMFNL